MDLAKWCPDRFGDFWPLLPPETFCGSSMIANRAHTRGFRAILPKVQKTMDWMVDQTVTGEPLSEAFFPASREKCRENPIFGDCGKPKPPKSARRIDTFDQIPYATEQGKLLAEQGKFSGHADEF